MQAIDHIFEEARRLPVEQQRRLIEKLQEEVSGANEDPEQARRMAALDKLLELAGTVHSDYTDVSSNKYKHLAEIYRHKP